MQEAVMQFFIKKDQDARFESNDLLAAINRNVSDPEKVNKFGLACCGILTVLAFIGGLLMMVNPVP